MNKLNFSLWGVQKLRSLLLLLILVLASACSSTPNKPYDPLEPLNRSFWTFTWDYSDKYVTKPVTQAYVNYTPTFVRTGLYNIALNLNEPSSAINSALQLKFAEAGATTGRFLVNSTLGLAGFFDLAAELGWQRKEEEFGEVLGKYGVSDGPFIMIPAIGPSSVREEVGDYIDGYYWPLAMIDFWPNIARMAIIGLEKRAALIEQESLLAEAFDQYEFVKNAYYQNMSFKVHDGIPPIRVNKNEEAELESLLEELD